MGDPRGVRRHPRLVADRTRTGRKRTAPRRRARRDRPRGRDARDPPGLRSPQHRPAPGCTAWQLKPAAGGRLEPNDHTDPAWDTRVLDTLAELDQPLPALVDRLTSIRTRFDGYDTRFRAALSRARTGDHTWIDRTDIDSCHRVWFEPHEDLIATLGIDRRTQQ